MPLAKSILLLLCAGLSLGASVVRVKVDTRRPVLEGRSFGLAGPYEVVEGKVYFAIDPANKANRVVTDIDLAPTNGDGKVEFSSDFYMIRPKDPSLGNGSVICEIGNRGRKGTLSMFNRAAGSLDPTTAKEFGDGLLLEKGFTLLWVGWQFDPPNTKGLMHLYPPIAQGKDGKPIRGLVRSDFVTNDREYSHSLADRNHIPYPVADPDSSASVLTVRDSVEAKRKVIPRERWKFARMQDGKTVADSGRVYLDGGFEPGKIYEVVYESENPPLVGAGPAAVRDFLAMLKHNPVDGLGVDRGDITRAIGFGTSQSGRFLRTFLYYGFNRDEQNRPAFDGVLSHVAGGGRGSFNHRFAQASRDAHPYLNFFYPTDIFPFSDKTQSDPVSGLTDGLLKHYDDSPELLPKIFYTNSSYEYWGRAASLVHTTIDGKRDIELPENVRFYHFAGSQHGPTSFPPRVGIGQQRSNPMDFRWSMRALVLALDRWAADGTAPPKSQYGRVEHGTLVTPEKLGFPKLPGVNYSTRIHRAYRADYGPQFYSQGIVTQEPPKIGPAFAMLVTAIDSDGNETAGIRLPELVAPLATYAGWNLFNERSGPTDEISSMQGSFIPFPKTKHDRASSGDPRLSIEERYSGRTEYLGRVAVAATELAERGYVLEQDVAELIRIAGQHWDHITASESGP